MLHVNVQIVCWLYVCLCFVNSIKVNTEFTRVGIENVNFYTGTFKFRRIYRAWFVCFAKKAALLWLLISRANENNNR